MSLFIRFALNFFLSNNLTQKQFIVPKIQQYIHGNRFLQTGHSFCGYLVLRKMNFISQHASWDDFFNVSCCEFDVDVLVDG